MRDTHAVVGYVYRKQNGRAGAMTTNKTRLLLVGLVCLALWPIASRGQSPELRTAHERTSDL